MLSGGSMGVHDKKRKTITMKSAIWPFKQQQTHMVKNSINCTWQPVCFSHFCLVSFGPLRCCHCGSQTTLPSPALQLPSVLLAALVTHWSLFPGAPLLVFKSLDFESNRETSYFQTVALKVAVIAWPRRRFWRLPWPKSSPLQSSG